MKRILFLMLLAMVAATAVPYQNEGTAAKKGLAGTPGGTVPKPVIDENELVTLAGNTRPEATEANDRGPVSDSFPLLHRLLQLRRTPQQEQVVDQFMDQLYDPKSPNFRHWVTAQEFGRRYGLPAEEIDLITGWLKAQGFVVNVVYPSHMLLDFSGNAGLVERAFHTEIHYLEVDGEKHFANMSDPKIPAMLAPMVAGVVTLHDFKAYPQSAKRVGGPDFNTGGMYEVAPADLATIYNFNQLFTFTVPITGLGYGVTVVEDSDMYSTNDYYAYRGTFGLQGYYVPPAGELIVINPPPPSGTNNCSDPGANGNQGEATLDVEMVAQAAPSALVTLASCADTIAYGFFTATLNLINSTNPPQIISMSYGVPETTLGSSTNMAINMAYQQGAAEGVSIFVASGDNSASGDRCPVQSGCGNPANAALHDITVNGFASTPYNVAVGATDFEDTFYGENSTYWSGSNTSTGESALSYVPEIPMADSCGGYLIAYWFGYSGIGYGSSGFCNSSTALSDGFVNTWGTGGGPSNCATGASPDGSASGTCAGYPKPSWQSVYGNPNDGVRDVPDVVMFGAVPVNGYNSVWAHDYVYCDSAPPPEGNGAPCLGGVGGTSASTPVVAGITALLIQSSGGVSWGNMAPAFYEAARLEYGSSGSTGCTSSNGNTVDSNCVFYDIAQGDTGVPCQTSITTNDCYLPSGTYGGLSTSTSSFQNAYGSEPGWDFGTGIGSINAYNLVEELSPPILSLTPQETTFGTQVVGTTSATQLFLTLQNIGLAPLYLSSYSISGGNNADFNVALTTCNSPIQPNASCKVYVTFTPTAPGPRKAVLSVVTPTFNPFTPPVVIEGLPASLTGVGTAEILSRTSIAFGGQPVGTSSTAQGVTLTNAGTGYMNIYQVAIDGANPGDFSITTNTCDGSLAPSNNCHFTVTFTPTATGPRSAALQISTNAGGPPATATLTGSGQ
ncbi:MAG: choice-of-anchor D domain-containing protein [Terriglobia bacterium]